MEDLIKALQILLKYGNLRNPSHCEHDYFYVAIAPELVSKDKDGKYIGFEGAGTMVVNHISLLGNGAVDSITDKMIFDATGGKATMTF